MTIKEQTIKRIEAQKEKIEEHKKEYGRVGLFDKLELKYLESVLKDLEVLETLKSKIRISNDLDVRMLDYPLFLLPMTKEERDKIKEWLENDR